MKRLALIALVLLVGCGGGGSTTDGNSAGSTQTIEAIDRTISLALKGPLSTSIKQNGVNAQVILFMGEIINNGETSVCGISIIINSTVQNIIGDSGSFDSQRSAVSGRILTNRASSGANCLRPGEFGAFSMTSHITEGSGLKPPVSISWEFEGTNDNIVEPLVPASDVVLVTPLVVGSDLNGNVTVSGTLKNNNNTFSIASPQVPFVALENGLVIGLVHGFIFKKSIVCKETTGAFENQVFLEYCLRPGQSVDLFFTLTITKAADMTNFYHKISFGNWQD